MLKQKQNFEHSKPNNSLQANDLKARRITLKNKFEANKFKTAHERSERAKELKTINQLLNEYYLRP